MQKNKTQAIHDARPLSPHLQIYKPQITSVLSITHRGTGFIMYFGLLILVWWIILAVYSPGLLKTLRDIEAVSVLINIFWAVNIFCIFYHLLNGIRHLFWDAGYGFGIKTTTKSGIAVILGSVIFSAILIYINFMR